MGLGPAFAQQNTAPQRTITSRDSAASPDQRTESDLPANSAAALQRYRQAWEKMTPAQQKELVSSGGYTPEQYERMLKQRGAGSGAGDAQTSKTPRGPAAPDATSGVDSGAFDALSKSLRDLNAIRDGNLSLVQKGGCPPELASRIADLKGKLQAYETELSGAAAPAGPGAAARSAEKADQSDPATPLALAADWFKRPAAAEPAAGSSARNRSREGQLLDAALAGTDTATVPERRIDASSPDAERKRKVVEDDMARVKAELEPLSAACAGFKK